MCIYSFSFLRSLSVQSQEWITWRKNSPGSAYQDKLQHGITRNFNISGEGINFFRLTFKSSQLVKVEMFLLQILWSSFQNIFQEREFTRVFLILVFVYLTFINLTSNLATLPEKCPNMKLFMVGILVYFD